MAFCADTAEKVIIHHAYGGFLYAPLFLAYDAGLLPAGWELNQTGTDAEALDKLANSAATGDKNWFAICDPFAKDLSQIQRSGTHESLILIGTLIDKPAVWIYSSNPNITRVNNENALKAIAIGSATRIVCYPKDTTGYLFGERVREKLGFATTSICHTAFGTEFGSPGGVPISANDLIVTSDVLRIAHAELNHSSTQPEVFSFVSTPPEDIAGGYLFTGIVAQEEILQLQFPKVLLLLNALKQAISWLGNRPIAHEHLKLIRERFSILGAFNGIASTDDEKNKLIHKATEICFQGAGRDRSVYEPSLVPSVHDQVTAARMWKRYGGGQTRDDGEHLLDKAPTLVLEVNRWKTRRLIDYLFAQVPVRRFSRRLSDTSLKTYLILFASLAICAAVFAAVWWIGEQTVNPPAGQVLRLPVHLQWMSAVVSVIGLTVMICLEWTVARLWWSRHYTNEALLTKFYFQAGIASGVVLGIIQLFL